MDTIVPTTATSSAALMKEALTTHKSLFQLPKVGELVEGTILGKESGVLYIDLGIIGTGVIYGREYFAVQDQLKDLKPGDKLSAKLIELENEDGYRELSLKEAGEEKTWHRLRELRDSKEPLKVKITEANRGGLMAQAGDMMGFIPVSQLAPAHYPRVEGGNKEMILEELRKFVGEELTVRILDAEPQENKLIFSERAAETDKIQDALGKYSVGDEVEGEITGVVEFGAFIKFDPLLEGLIHISELDWNLVKDPRDVVSVGQSVKAKIVDISGDGRVSLSLKALQNDPWNNAQDMFKEGARVEGEVTKINSYGALVKVSDGIQGLVHVSEFASEDEMKEQLVEGTTYAFEVISVEASERKIALRLAK
ncbi:MAG: S1 RNA-binding domain-containing protein [Candidatus Spechtbacterales bacterium]